QGIGGAVGRWTAHLAALRGLTVFGTASERTRATGEQLGATVLDYGDPDWTTDLRRRSSGGVDGPIDHTGSAAIRAAVRRRGRIVRIAFGGRPGHRRMATAIGGLRATARRFARPSEHVCSVCARCRYWWRPGVRGAAASCATCSTSPPVAR
ncbi:MAG TPA: hypothetical protein VI076_06750, partial [Actinopolymorphaceae bacterium]